MSDDYTQSDAEARQEALERWGKRTRRGVTQRESFPEPSFEKLDTAIRQVAKGVPIVGPYLDEANALTNAALEPLFGAADPAEGFSRRYARWLAAERVKDKKFETENPAAATTLQLTGAIGSGIGLARAIPGVVHWLFAGPGRSTAVGGAIGAIGGFGTGEGGLRNRLRTAAEGIPVGMGAGLILGQAGPAAASRLGPRLSRLPAPVEAGLHSAIDAMHRAGDHPAHPSGEAEQPEYYRGGPLSAETAARIAQERTAAWARRRFQAERDAQGPY